MLKHSLKFLIIIPFILAFTMFSVDKKVNVDEPIAPPFLNYSSQWVDSIFNSMTTEQKIGQLFMIPVYPNQASQSDIDNLINKYEVGGLIYFKGHPTRVAQLTNHFQSISNIPLMTAIDGEWGVGMRVDSTVVYPHQLMLGAIKDNNLIYSMGVQIAKQCEALGININFAPDIDINNNPMNPVIGVRSFGEDKIKVSQKGYAYSLGMQDNNVLAVAKHFPGHGDTDVDSHKDLPIINVSRDRLDSLEMFPFKQLINTGVGGIMMAHLFIPALDNTPNLPSSLSKKVVNGILVDELGFKGLIFTDALGMQGVAKNFGAGEAEVKALLAGDDILLMSQNVPIAYNAVLKAVNNGTIPMQIIDSKVKKILLAKYWMKLNKFKPLNTKKISDVLNSNEAQLLNRKLIESALTLVQNTDSTIPFQNLETIKIASISIGNGEPTVFQDYLSRYAKVDNFSINKSASSDEFYTIESKLTDYDYVIVGIHDTRQYSVKTYGITTETLNLVSRLARKQKIILDLFGNPYALKRFSNLDKVTAILVSYEDSKVAQELSAQLLFGGIPAKGVLPVSVNETYELGSGYTTAQIRLKYSIPEELNINYNQLYQIDTLIYSAIGQKTFPGCQILAIKNGVVFYQKSYGYHTYKMKIPVKWNDIYDIASITKVAATTTALMKLYDEGKFNIYDKMSKYLPALDSTNKSDIRVLDVMTHQAQLTPWIPFYKRALNKDGTWNKEYLSHTQSDIYNVHVSKNVYMNGEFQKEVYKEIYESKLLSRKRYKYSDLGFYLLKDVVKKQAEEPINEYVAKNFYAPLGAYSTGYNPLDNGFDKNQIPPTEYDFKFRKQLVQGYVHDYGAAIFGGVSGHAGLFSSANDLGKLLQMYLQGGEYAGKQYIKTSTLELFTKQPFHANRRAIGFDATDGNGEGPACRLSSAKSFGHTGFTGCMVWVDPQYDFVFVFLSNRIYPDIENKKINEKNIREIVQSLFYQSFLKYNIQ